MMTATKAFLAFCLLAVVGTVLVIGPSELRRLMPGMTTTEVAATKPAAKTEIAAAGNPEALIDAKPDAKPEAKIESKSESKAEPKPDEPRLAAVAPAAPVPPASPAAQPGALAETGRQAAALPEIAPAKPSSAAADSGPRFDVARIDDRGEAAVIAGQAAPGSKVELLRDGKPLDSVVADASGQFVMTPQQLPSGAYELSLRAKAPDGTISQSARRMPVTIAEAAPPAARPEKQETRQAEKPADKSDVVAALPSPRPAAERSAPQRAMGAAKPRLMARAPTAPAPASPAEILKSASTDAAGNRVIARGDSLWALSRLAYGDGARYAVIFNANRDKIHNPNLIYPGQTFVMPPKAE